MPTRKHFFLLSLLFTLACNLETTRPSDLATWTPAPTSPHSPSSSIPTDSAPVLPTVVYPPNPSVSSSIGPGNFPENVNPLTGLVVDDPTILDRRPVAVKINNYPRSNRPQWGLSLADIVYEFYHNNDLPRFHAIFYGHDAEMAGPIRSARPFDDYLVQTYKSSLVFGSADSRVLDRLRSQDYGGRLIYLLEGICPPQPVCRFDPQSVNYLVTGTAAVGDYIESKGEDNTKQNLDGMWFSDQTPSGGQSATRLYVRYSYSAYLYWEFDSASGRYTRYQDTQEDIGGRGEAYAPLTDRLNEETIHADNVVVLVIPHFHLVYHPASNGNPKVEIVDMNFEGTGLAFAMRDGLLYQLQWIRLFDGSVIFLIYPDGTRYPFKPGNTWFEVVNDQTLIENTDDTWRFTFIFRD